MSKKTTNKRGQNSNSFEVMSSAAAFARSEYGYISSPCGEVPKGKGAWFAETQISTRL